MIELHHLQRHKSWSQDSRKELGLKQMYAILFYSIGLDIGRNPDTIFDETTYVDSNVKDESQFVSLDYPKPCNRNNLILLNALRKVDYFRKTTSPELHYHFDLVTDEIIKQYLPSKQVNLDQVHSRKPSKDYFTTVAADNVHIIFNQYNIFDLEKSLFLSTRNDHFDTPLLRYIEAKKHNIGKALNMCFKTLNWRFHDHQLETYLFKGDYGYYNSNPKLINAFALNQAYLRGFDREGRPLVVIDVGKHFRLDCSDQEFERFICIIIEWTRLRLRESEGVNKGSILFDMSNFSMRNIDFHAVRFLGKAFEANYPEYLGAVLIHNAPWVFNSAWKIIKNILDPTVVAKIHFTYKTQDLLNFIDKKYIPKSLGGSDNFKMNYVSPTSKNARKKRVDALFNQLIYERYELFALFTQSTIDWFNATTKDDSYNFLIQRLDLQQQLARNYVQLDPYIRTRGVFERCGEIKELGI